MEAATRFHFLQVGCPRLYLVLVRTVLTQLGCNRDILLSWSCAGLCGWSRQKQLCMWNWCVFDAGRLGWLDISSAELKQIPDSIGQLSALECLDCSFNKLTSLPESIGQLAALTELNCSNNFLKSLPESLGQLMALTELDCSNNLLTRFPDSIGSCVSLRDLNCSNNFLASLPESFSRLGALRDICCDHDWLAESLGMLPLCTAHPPFDKPFQ